jgi:hypothetical protein
VRNWMVNEYLQEASFNRQRMEAVNVVWSLSNQKALKWEAVNVVVKVIWRKFDFCYFFSDESFLKGLTVRERKSLTWCESE